MANQSTSFPLSAQGRRHVIAVRVSFQADSNRYTSGDGTFQEGSLPYLDSEDIRIDPLPHNQTYFEHHLEFARRYFRAVSNQQLELTYQVSDQIYPLPDSMAAYSPTGESFTNEPLAELVQDVWTTVQQDGGLSIPSGLDTDQLIFVIFHAGVGRDIELTGTTLDKTPQDIPSLYLSKQSLSSLLDQPNFSGFSLNTDQGAIKVNHSLILPRTLSRRGEQLGSPFVLQLSTNGLIVASIANQLGLPDLFNTETGDSAIGQFGLMDGAGFFASNGLFPPEPSAWEKWALGWVNPADYAPEQNPTVTLNATSTQRPEDVARISISQDEYYLVENRYRDPQEDGVQLTIRSPEGPDQNTTITNLDLTDENDWVEQLPAGVLIEADHYDWSLPGGLDAGPDGELETADDQILNGGMLIWHIDEAVIRAKQADNAINTDPQRRGVDLEEADGAQDIGRTDADQLVGLSATGSAYDFWWSGNTYSVITETDTLQLYENSFGPQTTPSTTSNAGAPSYLELYDFSDQGSTTTFRLRRTGFNQALAQPVHQLKLTNAHSYAVQGNASEAYPPSLNVLPTSVTSDTVLLVPAAASLWGIHIQHDGFQEEELLGGKPQQPLMGSEIIVGEQSGSADPLTVRSWSYTNQQWTEQWMTQIPATQGYLSTLDGQTLDLDGTTYQVDLSTGTLLNAFPQPLQRTPQVQGYQAQISNDLLTISNDGSSQQFTIPTGDIRQYVGTYFYAQDQPAFYVLSDEALWVTNPNSSLPTQSIYEGASLSWPAFIDLDGDQRLDLLFSTQQGRELMGMTHQGSVLAHFPISAPDQVRFWGPPLIADINGDQQMDLIIPGTDGYTYSLYGFESNGSPLSNFPLTVGGIQDPGQSPIHPVIDEQRQLLWAVSPQGDLKSWKLPQLGSVAWKGLYGPNSETNKMGMVNSSPAESDGNSLLQPSETYNWPNPANEQTHFRFQVQEPARIRIEISSMSGQQMDKLTYDARAGAPQEIQYSTQSLSSGVYYVLIKAQSENRKDHKLIKMVVVH
ncbi:MAG: T9SS type A sorting domain-containing protein [Bacteroidota bacterium]